MLPSARDAIHDQLSVTHKTCSHAILRSKDDSDFSKNRATERYSDAEEFVWIKKKENEEGYLTVELGGCKTNRSTKWTNNVKNRGKKGEDGRQSKNADGHDSTGRPVRRINAGID